MEPYLIAIIVIGSLIVIGVIIFVSVYFNLGSSVVVTTTPVANVTIVPTLSPTPGPVDIRMKVLLPLYIYPPWDSVLVENNPQNLIAIMNPNSGPGDSYDSEYANAVANLQIAGSNVIGYIATNYASNSNISNLLQQVSNYNAWYGVNGIFYDEMSTQASNVSFYQDLYDQTKVVLEKNVNGNANIDTYPNIVSDFPFYNSGAIFNNTFYCGSDNTKYVTDVSNVIPVYKSGPYYNPLAHDGTVDKVSFYGNYFYDNYGTIYSISNSNVYSLNLVANFNLGVSRKELVNINKNETILYLGNSGSNILLRMYHMSNLQNFSNLDITNYISRIYYLNTFEDYLYIFGANNLVTASRSSNLVIYSGALSGSLTLENVYASFYSNVAGANFPAHSVIDKNGKYCYCSGSILLVSKFINNTATFTSSINYYTRFANITNDAEYLFLSSNTILLLKANLDVPYLLSNFTNAIPDISYLFCLCYNNLTNTLYYYGDQINKSISNIFSNSNISNHIIVGNPGTNTIESYANTADILVVYEGSNFSEYSSNAWQSNFSKNKFAALIYNSNQAQMITAVSNSNQSLGSIYVTDDVLPNPWDTIPSYYSLESNLINNNIVFF